MKVNEWASLGEIGLLKYSVWQFFVCYLKKKKNSPRNDCYQGFVLNELKVSSVLKFHIVIIAQGFHVLS